MFKNNKAENLGGAIYNENLQSIIIFENCSFINNTASSGGVLYINLQQFGKKKLLQVNIF